MAPSPAGSLLRQLRQTVLRHDGAGLTDGQLLRSFLYHRDEAAFEALVRRHGPMVRGVCRRILRNSHDVDDAFQAAFLVLLRKASSLATREVVGDWLHGVAYRTALKARTAAARRRIKERQTTPREAILEQEDRAEWLALLDREVGRLPEKYRMPVVLCDLQGRTRKEAAQQLGWPEGTLSGRLSRARSLLARRLTRQGVALSVGVLTVGLTSEASACLPFSLIGSTCKAAMGFAAGSAASAVPAHIAALTEGVVKAMLISKLKTSAALVVMGLVLAVSVGAWRYAAAAGQAEERRAEEKPIPMPRDRPTAPLALPADRNFQIDLKIMRVKDGQRKLLGEPRLLTLEGKPASFAVGQPQTLELGGGRTEEMVMGPTVRVVVRSDQGGKVRLDLTMSRPTQVTFGAAVFVETKTLRVLRGMTLGESVTFKTGDKDSSPLEVTATVQEMVGTAAKTIEAAEKDLKTAEFWRRAGHPGSAYFYYEVMSRRYPNTIYAERAKERMAELKKLLEQQRDKPTKSDEKPPARVGQIHLIGNKKIPDDVILKQVPLFPGMVLIYSDLRTWERNLARLKGLKSNPKVEVLDPEGEGVFKDIRITVEEK